MIRNVIKALDCGEAGIAVGDCEYLGVLALLVLHDKHSDWAGGHQAPGKGRLFNHDKSMELVPIWRQCFGNQPVIGWVVDRRIKHSVKPDAALLMVEFVLTPGLSRSHR